MNKRKKKGIAIKIAVVVFIAGAVIIAGFFILVNNSAYASYLKAEAKSINGSGNTIKEAYKSLYKGYQRVYMNTCTTLSEITLDMQPANEADSIGLTTGMMLNSLKNIKFKAETVQSIKESRFSSKLDLIYEDNPLIDVEASYDGRQIKVGSPVLFPDILFIMDLEKKASVDTGFASIFKGLNALKIELPPPAEFNKSSGERTKEYGAILMKYITKDTVTFIENKSENAGKAIKINLDSEQAYLLTKEMLERLEREEIFNDANGSNPIKNIKNDLKQDSFPKGIEMTVITGETGTIRERIISFAVADDESNIMDVSVALKSNISGAFPLEDGSIEINIIDDKMHGVITINSYLKEIMGRRGGKGSFNIRFEKKSGQELAELMSVSIDAQTNPISKDEFKTDAAINIKFLDEKTRKDNDLNVILSMTSINNEAENWKVDKINLKIVDKINLNIEGMMPHIDALVDAIPEGTLNIDISRKLTFNTGELVFPSEEGMKVYDLDNLTKEQLEEIQQQAAFSFVFLMMGKSDLLELFMQ